MRYTIYDENLFVSDDSDWLSGTKFFGIIGVFVITSMALVLLAALSYQCTATWKWIREKACGKTDVIEDTIKSKQQATIQISSSLPDLQVEQLKPTYVQEIKDIVAKKVYIFVI